MIILFASGRYYGSLTDMQMDDAVTFLVPFLWYVLRNVGSLLKAYESLWLELVKTYAVSACHLNKNHVLQPWIKR